MKKLRNSLLTLSRVLFLLVAIPVRIVFFVAYSIYAVVSKLWTNEGAIDRIISASERVIELPKKILKLRG
jgi:hypothetical protein